MSFNVYMEKYMNNVEITTSYGSKLHDEVLFDNIAEGKFSTEYKYLTDTEKEIINSAKSFC